MRRRFQRTGAHRSKAASAGSKFPVGSSFNRPLQSFQVSKTSLACRISPAMGFSEEMFLQDRANPFPEREYVQSDPLRFDPMHRLQAL
jgi:hypothetical protein